LSVFQYDLVLNIIIIIHFLGCFAIIYDIIIESQFIGEVYINLNRKSVWKSLLEKEGELLCEIEVDLR